MIQNRVLIIAFCICVVLLAWKHFSKEKIKTPFATSNAEAPNLSESESESAPAVKNSQPRIRPMTKKFETHPVQVWPAATKDVWKKDDYIVLPVTNIATVGIKKGQNSYYFIKGVASSPVRCAPGQDAPMDCLRLPNGQLIEVNPQLAARLSGWTVMRNYSRGMKNIGKPLAKPHK